jgi:hypothetical protein
MKAIFPSIVGQLITVSAIAVACALLAGCTSTPPPPQYAKVTPQQAVSIIAARTEAVHTVSAHAKLTLVNAAGDSVRMDAAVAMQRDPASLRLRAWKFGQAVFDLTMNPQGLWIMTGRDPNHPERAGDSRLSAVQMARAWGLFNGDLFTQENLIVNDNGGKTFQVQGSGDDGTILICTIDRATLTPVHYELQKDSAVHFTLDLSNYESFGDVVWPRHIHGTSDTGVFTADLDDIEINQPLADGSFVPPPTAERQ